MGLWSDRTIQQILTTDVNPLLVYALNTSTGFHPPHHETVYRSDDGGKTWRDVYFMDPRFKHYNIAPNYVTASVGQSFKGGDDSVRCGHLQLRPEPHPPDAQRL